jgi:hypothetical protein
MAICERCSNVLNDTETRSVCSEPGHALQILATDAAEWKARSLKAEARILDIEKAIAAYSTGLVVGDSDGWQSLDELLAVGNGKVKP